MKIPLTKGAFAIINDEDYHLVSQYSWHLSKGGYAARGHRVNGKSKYVFMHRVILGEPAGERTLVDHINGDVLDNRRVNLRWSTASQNQGNRRQSRKNRYSPFKGVRFDKVQGTWKAAIVKDRKVTHLGVFPDDVQAARAYDRAAEGVFGEFAKLNFA